MSDLPADGSCPPWSGAYAYQKLALGTDMIVVSVQEWGALRELRDRYDRDVDEARKEGYNEGYNDGIDDGYDRGLEDSGA